MLVLITLAWFANFSTTVLASDSPPSVKYDESYAKKILHFAAAAYSPNEFHKTQCVQKAFPKNQEWRLLSMSHQKCDIFFNKSHCYMAVSDVSHEIVVAFRGTTTVTQLLNQMWKTFRKNLEIPGLGEVNAYFKQAFEVLWKDIDKELNEPSRKNYTVIFTGHSLGGAMASLASARTVFEKLRTSDRVKLYTFGQPCVGPCFYAQWHDVNIPHSFRIVNSEDIVPELPGCAKFVVGNLGSTGTSSQSKSPKSIFEAQAHSSKSNVNGRNKRMMDFDFDHWNPSGFAEDSEESNELTSAKADVLKSNEEKNSVKRATCQNSNSATSNMLTFDSFGELSIDENPVDDFNRAFHHGTEIWYPNGMNQTGGEHVICSSKMGHNDCTNRIHLDLREIGKYIDDHKHYFGLMVSDFGIKGCVMENNEPKKNLRQKFKSFLKRFNDPKK